ncbi:MAG: 1-acyl-sn-glycerol-3-phosphate acyltransferase [Acidobacteria bacterium]|nr:1-acyl-sn-glycerol-3-phosphate acyltransferase [Acidobacteriota bacterium]
MKDHTLVVFCKWGLRVLFRVLFCIEYRGVGNVPRAGAAFIVPNHQSYLDPLLVGAALRRPVRYMAMKKLFKGTLATSFLRFYGAFPVSTHSADKAAVKACIRFLRAGDLVIIFPEGGRSRDGSLMDFLQGFARIALLEQTPIVPVTVSGAHRVWPPQRRLPRPGKVTLTFHPPIHPRDFPPSTEGGSQKPEGGSRASQIALKVKKTIASAL